MKTTTTESKRKTKVPNQTKSHGVSSWTNSKLLINPSTPRLPLHLSLAAVNPQISFIFAGESPSPPPQLTENITLLQRNRSSINNTSDPSTPTAINTGKNHLHRRSLCSHNICFFLWLFRSIVRVKGKEKKECGLLGEWDLFLHLVFSSGLDQIIQYTPPWFLITPF